jgi:hypothetical protein
LLNELLSRDLQRSHDTTAFALGFAAHSDCHYVQPDADANRIRRQKLDKLLVFFAVPGSN